jgi:hypothetical protein
MKFPLGYVWSGFCDLRGYRVVQETPKRDHHSIYSVHEVLVLWDVDAERHP